MTPQDFEYRVIHSVVPQLDFVNGGYDNIIAPPIQYTQFAFMSNPTRIDPRRMAGGAFGVMEGALHMAGGDFGYGLGKTIASVGKVASGFVDPNYVETDRVIRETIQEWEQDSWRERFFLANFVPAQGRLGDIVYEDGYDDFYTGLGHRIFENGDYFEGMFIDGRISEGIYIFANGVRYLGCFDENLNFMGLGTILYTDGACYYGNFVNSLRDGVGAMWYTDGVYIGRWSNNMRHGDGFFRSIDTKFYDGDFYNDQMVE